MRVTRILIAAGLFAAAFGSTPKAHADDEFDVAIGNGQVTVTTRSGWHINKDYPWKLVVGETKLEKAKFALAETTASVDAPKGAAVLKGAVCSADQCHPFKKELTIR
jgi:hypothetical protein